MAKTTAKKTTAKNDPIHVQHVIIGRVADLVVDLAKLKAGAPIDNLSTRLNKIAIQLTKQFDKINNAAKTKSARQAKLSARKIKLTEQLAKVEEQLS